MAKTKKAYTPAPAVPPAMTQRLAAILEVVAGRMSVARAARELGMSRNHFQTVLHRGLRAMLEAITPKQAGRPANPKQMVALEQENESLRRELARLRETAAMGERFLQAASGLLQGRIRPTRQARQRKSPSSADDDAAESEPRRVATLRQVDGMRQMGLSLKAAAALAGVHASTVRRWRRQQPRAATQRRGRCAAVGPSTCAQAADIVRRLQGQVGAEALRRSVPGLSRRQAARLKAHTITQMERARKQGLVRVTVSVPGIVRGMDGMHLGCLSGSAHALVCADAAVPYRTMVKVDRHYDAHFVARTIACDIEANGAPLVYRLDRAKAHDAPAVRRLLERHGILALHGPPHCPRFYGQLERQNREHRAWLEHIELGTPEDAERQFATAIDELNGLWRRRTLGWQTALDVWSARSLLAIDRDALLEEIEYRAVHIGRQLRHRGQPADLAQRLAIEQALETRGYLRQTIGGWC